MSKRSAIAKVTGIANDAGASWQSLIRSETVNVLAEAISHAFGSSSKKRPSRSACAQIALQLLLAAIGLRRAALIDALALTPAQASAISREIIAVAADVAVLKQVRLLYHGPTSQTFVVSNRGELWSDAAELSSAEAFWLDARLTPEHGLPTRAGADAHISALVRAIHRAVTRDTSRNVLIVSETTHFAEVTPPSAEAQLVGVALAGFLLEYGAIYCLHDPSISEVQCRYDVLLLTTDTRVDDTNFAASPPNCLASQPLNLFKVLWSDEASSLELLAFSIPQCLCDSDASERLRLKLTQTFQTRLDRATQEGSTVFRSGSPGHIVVQVTSVTLPQVAL